jgi:hypothetical protein
MLCQPLFVSLSYFSFGDCIVSPSSLYGSASDYPLVSSSLPVTYGRSVVSSTNHTDRHDIAEILLKVAL